MQLPFSAEQLLQHVNQDISACSSLLELLKQEQDALKKRDADTVEGLIDKKMPLLEILENSGHVRQSWARLATQDATDEGWASILSELGNSEVKTRWAELKSMYASVRQQNEINGKLLARHQKTVTRMLDVIRGKTAGPNLYNATGQSSHHAQGNNFGEA